MTHDYPNPQGLPRFIPPASTHVDLDTQCVICADMEPVTLEAWNDGLKGCKEYGAMLPDGSMIPLGSDEPIAEAQARHMADGIRKGMLTPSEAWEGGMGAAVCDWA